MRILPALIGFKIRHGSWRMPTLWFPILLLWPIFFLILFLVFFLGLLAVVILETQSVKRFLALFGGFYTSLCELRGTRIDVETQENQVFIQIS